MLSSLSIQLWTSAYAIVLFIFRVSLLASINPSGNTLIYSLGNSKSYQLTITIIFTLQTVRQDAIEEFFLKSRLFHRVEEGGEGGEGGRDQTEEINS